MERLTSLLLMMSLLPGVCRAADSGTVRFTVAGDVQEPATLEVGGDAAAQPVFVRDLLDKAGISGEGNAVILRADSQGGGSEFVSPRIAGRGSLLSHGDIVVFHQMSGPRASEGHVVVIADHTPRIVQLAAISSRLGNLLGSLDLAFSPGTSVPVVRTDMGRPIFQEITPNDVLMHGDVILLNRIVRVDPLRISRVFHPASHSVPAAAATPIAPAVPDEQSIATSEQTTSAALTLPQSESVRNESVMETPALPVIPVAAEIVTTDPIAITEAATAEAVPPVIMDPAISSAEAVSPIWNGVFICGLLGSITLIITGWMKTRREQLEMQQQEQQKREEQPVAVPSAPPLQMPREIPAPSDAITTSWRSVHEMPSSTFAAEDVTLADVLPSPVAEAAASVKQKTTAQDRVDRLVSEQEWIGGDWRENVSTSTPVAREVEHSTQETSQVSPVQYANAAAAPTVADETVEPAMATPQSVVPTDTATPADPSPAGSADDLEDLIQNRLPMELKQASLPLRVTLFGRPAGPRRLRIDAAHTQIAAPNFAAGPRARRDSSSGMETVSAAAKQDADDAASLDRALNSLHGQDHK